MMFSTLQDYVFASNNNSQITKSIMRIFFIFYIVEQKVSGHDLQHKETFLPRKVYKYNEHQSIVRQLK